MLQNLGNLPWRGSSDTREINSILSFQKNPQLLQPTEARFTTTNSTQFKDMSDKQMRQSLNRNTYRRLRLITENGTSNVSESKDYKALMEEVNKALED